MINWFGYQGRLRPVTVPLAAAGLKLWLRVQGYNPEGDFVKSGEVAWLKQLDHIWRNQSGLVVDCGAHQGDYTSALLELTKFQVVAIEPDPKQDSRLTELESMFPERLKVFRCAVGSEAGDSILHRVGKNSGGSTLAPEVLEIGYLNEQLEDAISVSVRTLDSILDEVRREKMWDIPIALLKIDVEGYEDEVLRGAQKTLENYSPGFIQFEGNWHQLFRGSSVRELASMVANFELFQILPKSVGVVPRDPSDWRTNIFAHANFVLARTDLQSQLR